MQNAERKTLKPAATVGILITDNEKRTTHIFYGYDVPYAVTRTAFHRSLTRLPGKIGPVFSIDRLDGGCDQRICFSYFQ
jgi:hypothetical protein